MEIPLAPIPLAVIGRFFFVATWWSLPSRGAYCLMPHASMPSCLFLPFDIQHSAFSICQVPPCDTSKKTVLAKRTHLKAAMVKSKQERTPIKAGSAVESAGAPSPSEVGAATIVGGSHNRQQTHRQERLRSAQADNSAGGMATLTRHRLSEINIPSSKRWNFLINTWVPENLHFGQLPILEPVAPPNKYSNVQDRMRKCTVNRC